MNNNVKFWNTVMTIAAALIAFSILNGLLIGIPLGEIVSTMLFFIPPIVGAIAWRLRNRAARRQQASQTAA